MPGLHEFLHYRIIDVSTIKELARRWFPTLPMFNKKLSHRALDDIVESIEELKYYEETLLKMNPLHYQNLSKQ
jgi:oligoribonuclease